MDSLVLLSSFYFDKYFQSTCSTEPRIQERSLFLVPGKAEAEIRGDSTRLSRISRDDKRKKEQKKRKRAGNEGERREGSKTMIDIGGRYLS